MTAERVMTLEQGSKMLREMRWGADAGEDMMRLADAIDAHLSRAAEPVGAAQPVTVTGVDAGKFTAAVFKSDEVPAGTRIYTHPPEPARDAKDAARYRWLRVHVFDDQDWGQGECNTPEQVDTMIDAAAAQESGDAT